MNKGTTAIRKLWWKELEIADNNNEVWKSLILKALLKKTENEDLSPDQIRKAKAQIVRVGKKG